MQGVFIGFDGNGHATAVSLAADLDVAAAPTRWLSRRPGWAISRARAGADGPRAAIAISLA